MNPSNNYHSDADRWKAVSQRDPRAEGSFLYAVKTTGVFCRPTCPSRLPNHNNVVYFANAVQAERNGFRACKKCKPKDSNKVFPQAVKLACQLIEEAEQPPSLIELSQAVGLSPAHFHRLFKSVVGVTPKAYGVALRDKRLRDSLHNNSTITAAIYNAGYGTSSRCYENTGERLGMTPAQFRGGGTGQLIRYSVVESPMGWLVVAATDRGLCLVEFGESPQELRAKTRALFPNATIDESHTKFHEWVNLVVQQIELPDSSVELPLDVQGTAFQRKVWEALRSIPVGLTWTYSDLAEKIGQPAAARSVATACAANRVAVVVPCHRVVRRDGDLGGYRWGIDRKAELIRRERHGLEKPEP